MYEYLKHRRARAGCKQEQSRQKQSHKRRKLTRKEVARVAGEVRSSDGAPRLWSFAQKSEWMLKGTLQSDMMNIRNGFEE